MSSYNLDQNQPEYFDFSIGGHQYRMRYPTTAEAFAGKAVKDGEEGLKWVCGFITKVDEVAPDIEDVLKNASVKVMGAFNAMIKKEFGDEA
jgi:hypothetical protein